MRTFDVQEAADFLHISARVLRKRARNGEVPAARPGKCWVFIEEDLVEYLRHQYSPHRHMPRAGSNVGGTTWESTNAERYGGSGFMPPMASEYERVLKRRINKSRKRCMTG